MRAFSANRVCSRVKGCASVVSPRGVMVQSHVTSHGPVSDRRALLLALGGATVASLCNPLSAFALSEGFTTFYGADTPPTSYGGYGGTMRETPKYVFDYPEEWKPSVVNKVQKVSDYVTMYPICLPSV